MPFVDRSPISIYSEPISDRPLTGRSRHALREGADHFPARIGLIPRTSTQAYWGFCPRSILLWAWDWSRLFGRASTGY